jgi:3-deoxy-D-manno-octulosonate 8-phosphate phosphatase KdsC-like HAD superfamily phosphatase
VGLVVEIEAVGDEFVDVDFGGAVGAAVASVAALWTGTTIATSVTTISTGRATAAAVTRRTVATGRTAAARSALFAGRAISPF